MLHYDPAFRSTYDWPTERRADFVDLRNNPKGPLHRWHRKCSLSINGSFMLPHRFRQARLPA